jgi:LPXTG-site transpeptidase (sortase) family protein
MHPQDRGIIGNIAQNPFAFAIAFALFFLGTVLFLGAADALPEPSKTNNATTTAPVTTVPQAHAVTKAEEPVRISAASVGMDTPVLNPASTKVSVLDEALLKGAVRYPTSAELGQEGTVLLFGHSSYLPVIHNQAYKAFKGIQNLKDGEIIKVYSATTEYRYAVESVSVADANQDVIELSQTGKYLVLVTCDTFSKKSSRFVVVAKFVGAYPLTSN